MELTPEERRKIYEEEKARIEAREQLEREKHQMSADATINLMPNVAGMLCYLGAWITGIIFFILERKNQWLRFHAAQSIVVFGALFIISAILGWIPFAGPVFSTILGIIGFILWIILMVKAYHGEYYKLPVAGDIAEIMVAATGPDAGYRKTPEETATPEAGGKTEHVPPQEPDGRIERKVENFFERRRAGRITASVFSIAWSIALLVFFNYYYQYAAYYHADTFGGVTRWERYPFFTDDIHLWLPILTASLVIAIIGHFILIFYDRYAPRQVIRIIIDVFGLATAATLLNVFPFDFYVIPNAAAAAGTQIGVTITLVLVILGFSIAILVRVIKLIINVLKGTATYERAV